MSKQPKFHLTPFARQLLDEAEDRARREEERRRKKRESELSWEDRIGLPLDMRSSSSYADRLIERAAKKIPPVEKTCKISYTKHIDENGRSWVIEHRH